jgi:pyruvate/2-oxoglutarate dehydrogenase complex dihydrolipoamide acyltransferase (E2) component
VLEAMKMEHVIEADRSGIVRALAAAPGDTVAEGEPLVWLEEARSRTGAGAAASAVDPGSDPRRSRRSGRAPRARLRRAPPRRGRARRKTGQRTARENVEDLCDPGQLPRVRPARDRRAAPPPHARRPDAAHARRRPDRGDRQRERRAVRRDARAAPCSPTTTPCSRERRGSRTTARRTVCSSSPRSGGCRS